MWVPILIYVVIVLKLYSRCQLEVSRKTHRKIQGLGHTSIPPQLEKMSVGHTNFPLTQIGLFSEHVNLRE